MEQIKVVMRREGLTVDCDREQFAMALKTYRLRAGLTQQQLADRWQCNRYTITRAERAKPISWEMAYRLFAKLSNDLTIERGTSIIQ